MLSAEVEQMIAHAVRRRRRLIERAAEYERQAGGVNRSVSDAPTPWWARDDGAAPTARPP